MFRSAYLSLTAWYLGIILLLSLSFSVAIYRVSANQFDQNLRRQTNVLRTNPIFSNGMMPDFTQLDQLRADQNEQSKTEVIFDLIYFNIVVLILGGGASYLLARRTLEPIEEAHDAQRRFTADASHELRTPLTAMKTELEVAIRDPKLSLAESKELLNSNLEEVERLITLSSSLLTLTGQRGKLAPDQLQDCPLPEIAEKAVAAVQSLAKRREIAIAADVATGSIRGDLWSLTELTTILLDNAIKYSPNNTTVTLTLALEEHGANIVVADQGQGIKSSDLPHIFERFYRADTSRTNSRIEGYGLGLSIAKKIADLHRAKIEVRSTLGKGSRFTVSIPKL